MTTLVRPLSQYDAMALGVSTKGPKAAGIKGRSAAGESDAPAFELTGLFTFQSYFDDTLAETAILAQPSNEPIVPSTLSDPIQVSGYGIGLHPSSECPVAVRFQTGAQQGASPTYRLKPGQVIRPHGSMGGQPGSFSGLQWGLPFGWLGGGSATLVVLRTPDAEVFWTDGPEIIFHRIRLEIVAPGNVPAAANVPLNWPKRFPWPNATFGANAILQSGQPALAVTPTRTAMRLRLDVLAAPATMRVLFCGTNDFAQDSAGAVSLADVAAAEVTWGTWDQAGVATLTTQYQTQMLTGQFERFAADNGGVVLFESSGAGALDTNYVDIVRYGRL